MSRSLGNDIVRKHADDVVTSPLDLSPQALAERVDSTLRLIVAGAEFVRGDAEGTSAADKAACEQLILVRGVVRAWSRGFPDAQSGCCRRALTESGVRSGASWAEMIGFLEDVSEDRLRGRAVKDALFWRPERAPLLGIGTALLDQLGRKSERWRNNVLAAWSDDVVALAERTPFQNLELRWSRALLYGGTAEHFSWSSDDRRQALRSGWHALMTQDDGYAWTHTIFYLTDFGTLPLLLDQDETHALSLALDAAVIWSLARYDFDLLGEFLMAEIYAGVAGTQRWHFGAAVLLATWDDLGWVPDRPIDLERIPSEPRSRDFYYAIYHANLVAGLLATEMATRAYGLQLTEKARTREPAGDQELPDGAQFFGEAVWRQVRASIPERIAVEALLEVSLLMSFWRRELISVHRTSQQLSGLGVQSGIAIGALRWLHRATTPR